jgi:hypothetical protein
MRLGSRYRRAVAGLFLAGGAARAALACGFPDATFVPARDGAASTVGADQTGTSPEATSGDDAVAGDEQAATTADASAEGAVDDAAEDAGAIDGPSTPDAASDGPVCNCDGWQMYPVNFGGVCGLLGTGLACLAPGGFVGSPACGESADYVTCDLGLGCSAVHSTKVQQCMP